MHVKVLEELAAKNRRDKIIRSSYGSSGWVLGFFTPVAQLADDDTSDTRLHVYIVAGLTSGR